MITEVGNNLRCDLKEKFPKSEYGKSERGKACGLHYMLIHSSQKQCLEFCEKWVKARDVKILTIDKDTGMTPLMIATALGNEAAVKILLGSKDVQKTLLINNHEGKNAVDYALFLKNAQILKLFKKYHFAIVKSEYPKLCRLRVNQMDTHQKKLTTASLERTWFDVQGKLVKGSDLSSQKIEEITGIKEWRDFIYCDPNQKTPSEPGLYQIFVQDVMYPLTFPELKIVENSELKKLGIDNCLGLFANEEIPPFTVVGIYGGEIFIENVKHYNDNFREKNHFNINGFTAQEIGSAPSRANAGFPNTVMYDLNEMGNRECYLICGDESIPAGQEILWQYGPKLLRMMWNTPFCILGLEQLDKFYESGLESIENKFSVLKEIIKKSGSSKEIFFKSQTISDKIHYCLNQPLAMLRLHYHNKVAIDLWTQCHTMYPAVFESVKNLINECGFPYRWPRQQLIKFVVDFDAEFQNSEKFEAVKEWVLKATEEGKWTALQIVKAMQLFQKGNTEFDEIEKCLIGYDPLSDKECILHYDKYLDSLWFIFQKKFGEMRYNQKQASLSLMRSLEHDLKYNNYANIQSLLDIIEGDYFWENPETNEKFSFSKEEFQVTINFFKVILSNL